MGMLEEGTVSNIIDLAARQRSTPDTVNGKDGLGVRPSPPRRVPNADLRSREYLTPDEAERLIETAGKQGRHQHRDRTLMLLMYRHGLRVSEATALRWDAVDLQQGTLHVSRVKNGVPSVHPLRGPEIRALRKLKRDYPATPYVFVTERDGPLTTSTVRKMVSRAGERADLGFTTHPHMLRHGCGYKLANEGHDTRAIQSYLGHRNIQHTVRYTELSATRFNGFWKD